MGEIINLFTDGEVTKGEKTFTRLIGGFNESDSVISDLQIAKLLEYKMGARNVRLRIAENIKHFKEGLHYLDVSERVTEHNTLKETLVSLGYSKQAITQAKNIYILSKAGFLLYLKFAEGDKAVEVYKEFLEDYFKTKAENESMKYTIEQTIEDLKEEKATLLGKAIMAKSDSDRIEFMQMVEKKNEQIIELEKSMSEKHIIEKLSSKTHLADLIEDGKSNFDIGVFARIVEVDGMGRTNMFRWMKEKKILMKNNTPYQNYMDYFKVIPVTYNGYTNPKTLLKPKGVDYIMKKLIKDGKIVTKSVEEVLSELNQAN